MRYLTTVEWMELIVREVKAAPKEGITIGVLTEKFKTSSVTIKPAIEILKSEGTIVAEYRGRSVVYVMRG
jgi:dUTPase